MITLLSKKYTPVIALLDRNFLGFSFNLIIFLWLLTFATPNNSGFWTLCNNILAPTLILAQSKSVDVNLDNEINGQIAIIGEGNIDDYLDHDTVSLFKKLNTKFINILDYSFKNTDLREMIKVGFILVRPDFHIYGVTDSEHNLQELAEQFFASLCLNK